MCGALSYFVVAKGQCTAFLSHLFGEGVHMNNKSPIKWGVGKRPSAPCYACHCTQERIELAEAVA